MACINKLPFLSTWSIQMSYVNFNIVLSDLHLFSVVNVSYQLESLARLCCRQLIWDALLQAHEETILNLSIFTGFLESLATFIPPLPTRVFSPSL